MSNNPIHNDQPHRRFNPLLQEWVLVSPNRTQRPWQGKVEKPETLKQVRYDKDCYLCPGNLRINGNRNIEYEGTFVFENDFPALTEVLPQNESKDPIFQIETERGKCRVICYSPDHSKSLSQLSENSILRIVREWVIQSSELGKEYPWVQIFENKGQVMGCSNPHPHGQVWAQSHIPSIANRKQQAQLSYFKEHKRALLTDYTGRELISEHRIVVQNSQWVVVVPFWAAWPFETLVLPKFSVSRLTELTTYQQEKLAEILKILTTKYDNLFQCSFPYSMGWHGAPFDGKSHPEWVLHASFFPPLLRSSSIKKFMVGYEMMAEPQRDITPEAAAKLLRQLSSVHYMEAL